MRDQGLSLDISPGGEIGGASDGGRGLMTTQEKAKAQPEPSSLLAGGGRAT